MSSFQFKGILQNQGWISPAYVQVDDQGVLRSLSKVANPEEHYESVDGYALPGIPNAHSHAFQYAMAGLNEHHSPSDKDDFWGWRNRMYQLSLKLNPNQMEAIATMLYAEMLRYGYTSVAEFHYLHHDPSGNSYSDSAEMGKRILAAAHHAGIKITLLPVFYQKGGFGKFPDPQQKRFISSTLDQYLQLFEASKRACNEYGNTICGYAIHSLRAVEPILIRELLAEIEKDKPIHLHIAEQKKEVTDSIQYLGKRPVEWLLENTSLNESWNLVHATHLNQFECKSLAQSKAQVILCPSTEGNLGDGLFPFIDFQQQRGKWCIGTDSHIRLNPFLEAQLLDYGQRLTTHQRNIFQSSGEEDCGLIAINQIIKNGRKAMGRNAQVFFEVGQEFDAMIIKASHPLIANTSLANLTSTIVYASDTSMHLGTLVDGKWVVKEGIHLKYQEISQNFYCMMQKLKYR